MKEAIKLVADWGRYRSGQELSILAGGDDIRENSVDSKRAIVLLIDGLAIWAETADSTGPYFTEPKTLVFHQLTNRASIALAGRSHLRALPAYGGGKLSSSDRAEVEVLEACGLLSLLVAESQKPADLSDIATSLRQTVSALRLLDARGPTAALFRSAAATMSAISSFFFDADASSKYAHDALIESLTATLMIDICREALAESARDYDFIQEFIRSALPTDMGRLYQRPLWVALAALETIRDWNGELLKVGLDSVQKRYMSLIQGEPLDPTQLRSHLTLLEERDTPEEALPAVEESTEQLPEALRLVAPAAREPVGRFTALGESVADQDLLGRQGLVDALAAMFGDPQQSTPFTLAVLGDWGAGKSSLMNLVQRQLTVDQHSRFDFAWFNAWEYENTGNMPAGLAQEVVEALVGNMSRWDKVKLRFRFGAREHRWSLVRALFYTLAAVVPLATFAAVAAWIEENQLLESLLGVGAGAGLVVFGVQVFRSAKRLWEHPMAVELKTYLDLPSYGQHLGLIPVLKRHLRTLCELRLIEEAGKRRRLVCFVDDLDRCKPESITQTLEAIRLVMDLQNVIVMIGIDQRIAVQAVADQYHDLASPGRPREDIARDYLGKIVQLSIRLDRPDASNLQAFIEGVLFRGAEAGEHENTNHTAAEAEPHLRLVQPGPAPDTGLVAPAGRESAPAFADATKEPDGQLSSPEPDRSLFAEPSVPVDLTVAMTDTAEERDRFYELALAHGFFNPRQLTRIRNSYRLLKLLEAQVAQSSPGDLSHEQMMRMIFWQELLQAWPRHVRDGLGGWLLGHNPPKDLPAEARSAFQAVAQPLRDCLGTDEVARRATYDRCAAFASLLVLPRGD